MDTLLKESLTQLIEGINSTSAFIVSEAPIYIQQYLQYELYKTALPLIALVPIFLLSVYLLVRVVKWYIKQDDKTDCEFVLVMACLLVFIMLGINIASINKIVKIKIAPKVVVVDHLTAKLSK